MEIVGKKGRTKVSWLCSEITKLFLVILAQFFYRHCEGVHVLRNTFADKVGCC